VKRYALDNEVRALRLPGVAGPPTTISDCPISHSRGADTEPARLMMADPPWLFDDGLPGQTRGASSQYPCMTLGQLMAFKLPPLRWDCMLLMWRVASMQSEALYLMRAWGFELKSELVWRKLTRTGKQHFGMGHYVRAAHETCLIGVRGSVVVASRSVRSVFDAPVGRHSEKPDEAYRIAEQLSPGPYVELFARRRRPGWQCYGNELERQG
jgi:N6-adenosine-specific RNA methylase IME4